ncbi:MAG TPA: methyltransferase domain-containing protein, partial [Candidatus Thermoplasmatota archaeon]|nr:methyltransferase domain-containing protein [Candidatus Thermoplasmatota archaeon]
VAMMTSALQLKEGDKVLEVGTGVGYHAAIVKAVVGDTGRVITIEYLPELVQVARKNLKAAKSKVEVHEGDGYNGYAKEGPYDAVYVTCAIPDVPDALIEQLKDGGHFVAPLGITRCQLMAGRKVDGELELEDLGPCLFVNAQGELGGGDETDDDEPEEKDEGDDDSDDIVKA